MKRTTRIFSVMLLFLFAVLSCGLFGCFDEDDPDTNDTNMVVELSATDLSIHTMELGNGIKGNCTYIKAGETDILIDAGSRASSVPYIERYINRYVKDNKLEYVIVTHTDKDHISGFVAPRGILDIYDVDTIIDYSNTNVERENYPDYEKLQNHRTYQQKRQALVEQGTKAYTALECFYEQNGAQKIYDLGAGIKMEILYNYFYDHVYDKTFDPNADYLNENNYSVCLMLTQGSKKFLFCADLEEDAEPLFVSANNKNGKLENVEYFQANHHGSGDANSSNLLKVIKPQVIVIPCVIGNDIEDNETYPGQEAVDNIAKYGTQRVYVPTIGNKQSFRPLNGDIVAISHSDLTATEIKCSNNTTKLKDTAWFKQNREMPDEWK